MFRFFVNNRGAASVEFAIVLTLLTIPVLNVVDLALYAWDRMQVDNAAQAGAQAAWATCGNTGALPATTPTANPTCPAMTGAIATAVQSTSLGANVGITATTENYYCMVSSALYTQGTFPSNKPSDCSAWGGSSGDQAGDYILITVQYTYTPIFGAVSIASTLGATITRQAWMRLG